MADTYTTRLGLRLIETGTRSNTWGTTLNTDVFQLLDDAIAGYEAISVASGNVTLTSTDGASNQARQAFLKFTGAPGAARTVTAPSEEKIYLVWNAVTDGNEVTIKTSAGNSCVIPPGVIMFVGCDGTDFHPVQSMVQSGHDAGSGATGLTLTRLSARSQNWTSTAASQAVTLPDATTLALGEVWRISNSGSTSSHYSFSVKDDDGTELITLGLTEEAVFILEDNTTNQGTWRIVQGHAPVGSILIWPGSTTPPGGYLQCDGSAVSRTTYARLYSVLGVMYGSGDGSTTFNLPDYRGEFLRGYDDAATNDPDAASRTDRGDGTTGDAIGTKQAYAIKTHGHDVPTNRSGTGATDTYWVREADNPYMKISEQADLSTTHVAGLVTNVTTTGINTSSSESRPRNVSVMYCIKY